MVIVHAPPGFHLSEAPAELEEFLVLHGALQDEQGLYPAGTWLRQPAPSAQTLHTVTGCAFWMKRQGRTRSTA